jgi:hypothetical protein
MNCAQVEVLLCDYLDGTLPAGERTALEQHLSVCLACAELARDASGAVEFIGRAAAVEPPPELITRILYEAPWIKARPRATQGMRAWLQAVWEPVRQPRFALGMAMTILSCSMLWRYVAPVRQLRAEDLQPAKVWTAVEDRGQRMWARTVKYYQNMKFVYQIQSTLREWQQQQDEERKLAGAELETPKTDERKLTIQRPAAASPAEPHSKPRGTGETR